MFKSDKIIYNITLAAVFATIDYILAMFQIHIPSPVGRPFIDLGFTFVVLGVLFLEYKYGLLSGIIGLTMFDLMNGYAPHAYLTVMEVFIVASTASLTFKILKHSTKTTSIITLGIVTGLSKILSGFLRYFIEAWVVGMHGRKLLATAILSMPASIVTGIAMFFTVPLFFWGLYQIMKIVIKNHTEL